MKILVTGASGFIGSYIVEEALRQGMETWAAVRPTSSSTSSTILCMQPAQRSACMQRTFIR